MTKPLAEQSPAEIDTAIARWEVEFSRAQSQAEQAADTIARIDGVQDSYEAGYPWNSPAKRAEAAESLAAAEAAQDQAREALYPLCAEYRSRPWPRYYLVTNAGGHVHSSIDCETCFPTTRFAWLTEQSGMTAEDLVEMAGEMACTVCFPWAPVDVLKRKSTLEAPERKAARLEREAKRAAKAAAEVTVERFVSGTDRRTGALVVRAKVFKSERAVTNQIASDLGSLAWYGESHPSAPEWLANITACREALAARGVEYDYDKALANARKRVTREGGSPKF